jgi:2-desacetyl-2-hydroxyethyl bacteriochlorophyllide A dehydrogenase
LLGLQAHGSLRRNLFNWKVVFMNALWLENRVISYRTDLPLPEPGPQEALIRVSMAGVCATDLEQVRGYLPFCGVPGHEFVGVVEAAPAGGQWVGQRVVGGINIVCGSCCRCREGLASHCENRQVIGILNRNGCFAEYLVLPIQNLCAVPDSVTDEAAVFAEPLAAALEILQQIQIRPTDRVLLIGAGRLGQLIARVIQWVPCSLLILARYASQRVHLEASGVQVIHETDLPEGEMDLVIEATGSLNGFELALKAVRPRGTILLKSTYAGSESINLSKVVVDEITMVGSRCGPIPAAVALLESGRVDPRGLIADVYPLQAGLEAYQRAASPGVLKVLLKI